MVALHTLGHNSVGKLMLIARIFSFIIPLKHSAPPFWSCVYGIKGSILIPRCFKYSVIYNFYVIILLLYLSIVRDTFY